MLIEDEPRLATALKEELEADGHHVLVADTAYRALLEAPIFAPDLLISDFSLGGELNGAQVCQIIRTNFPSVPVIIMTGHQLQEVVLKCLSLMPLAVLEKPVAHETLSKLIARITTH